MESENIYQHHQLQQQQQQQQQQLVYSPLPSSSSSSSPIVSTAQEWNPSSIVLVGDEFNRYMNEILPSSREYFWPKNIDLVPSVKRSIFEVDHYTKPCEFRSYVHPLPEKLLHFDDNTPKGSLSDGFLKSCDTNVSILNNSCVKNGQEQDVIDLNQNLWISSFSDIGPMKQKLPQTEVFPGLATCPPTYMSNCSSGSTTDHHYSNLFASTSVLPTSVTLPLPTHNLKHTNYDDEGRTDQPFAERMSSGYSKVQQSSESLSNSSNKTAIFRKDVWRKNKHLKPTHAASDDEVAKKPRVVPHASSPTLKIRKEKLGDRIAALHRMVSPFGKTDTASVLTEAFGYIQFLQDQIQTLSISYFKSSRGRLCPTTRGGQPSMKEWKDEEEQKTQDLRSRGLCLVPLAFTSYVCSYNGSIW